MNVSPIRLAVADSPRAALDERILRRLEQRGLVRPYLIREPDFSGIAAADFDALFVPELRTPSLRRLARRVHPEMPILLGSAPLPRLRRRLLRSVDLLFYASDAARTERLRCGIEPKRLFFLPPHVIDPASLEEQRIRERRAGELRASLGIPDEERVLLFAGEFVEENAPGILLESFLFRLRERELPNWTLALAGSGPLEKELRELAGTSPHVCFLPPGEEPAALRRLGELVVLPSKTERTGIRAAAVTEAMAASRPVLVTENAGAALSLIRPGENGWSVDSAHPELWFDYIRTVSGEQLHRMGKAAYRAASAWNSDAAAASIELALKANPDFFPENGG